MTYWTDHHASSFGTADNSIHAGITKKYVMDNCSCAYEKSTSYLDSYKMDTGNLSHASNASWHNYLEWQSIAVPVYLRDDGTYRDIVVKLLMKTGSYTTNVRAILTPIAGELDIDPYGALHDDYPYDETSLSVSPGATWLDFTITPNAVIFRGGGDPGLYQPCVYLQIAVQSPLGTSNTYIYAHRIYEEI